jgi:hypothetical protein
MVVAHAVVLAGTGDQGMTRNRLLWSESDEERARKGLNQALYACGRRWAPTRCFSGLGTCGSTRTW